MDTAPGQRRNTRGGSVCQCHSDHGFDVQIQKFKSKRLTLKCNSQKILTNLYGVVSTHRRGRERKHLDNAPHMHPFPDLRHYGDISDDV